AEGDPEEAGTEDSVRKALLAPPWPLEQGRLLPSGRARVLSLDVREARPVGAQVLCGSTPPRGRGRPPAAVHLRAARGRPHGVEQQVEDGKTALLTFVMDVRGRHQLEVQHARNETPALGLVRFVDPSVTGTESTPLASQQPLTMLRSKPGTPVVMTVLGPGALRIQARALSPQAGRHVLLSSVVLPTGRRHRGRWRAGRQPGAPGPAEDADPTVRNVSVPVGRAGETWLLLSDRARTRSAWSRPRARRWCAVELG
ncbi:hypothetical protein ACLESD_53190, partial [Pyxidicoccus sp. 3LFB2]